MSGRLILCATPIGNLEDISPRALRTLGEADVVACEDSRRTLKLLTHFGIKAKRLVTYNDANERRMATTLLEMIQKGKTVTVVSDAGTPGLSDPGYRLVRACAEAGLEVDIIPGPNAAVSALAVSGLPPGRFVFEGFLPRRSSERRRRIEELRDERRTLVMYESPHRLIEALEDLADLLGPRPAAIVRELTKLHGEVVRGPLPVVLDAMREKGARGEIVLVVGGAVHGAQELVPPEELARRARSLMEEGTPRRDALVQVAREAGVPKRRVFDALLEEG